ncbi:phosphoenolpyruvate--protein phosphotransferase [Paenibacillus alkaliterrae]|uniref:phosphoenolpyruvate--protein phosphotransferase n=1 Tax=Paenibacillus alkaliterrae TaxID=320909 RepID=UPI001F41906F|nr:phosphoenolpyruvate--protein phosphotransferase [Paenibacillus alkaliterrae]MCF2938501.1 phosphoenolpyruvate--protein phosphotransferase [Paenibacillus alkaliterrae]
MMLQGIAASPGYAIGRAKVLSTKALEIDKIKLDSHLLDEEVARFEAAVAAARIELEAVLSKLVAQNKEHEAEIFEAHVMLLEDEELIDRSKELIKEEQLNAEYAFYSTSEDIAGLISGLDDPYLRERAADIRDVSLRVLNKLRGVASASLDDASQPIVLFADDLAPSDTAQLDPGKVIGFATKAGGRTSHSAIIARSIGIPAIVGIGAALDISVKDGQTVIIDGSEGHVYIDPDEATLARYRQMQQEQLKRQEQYQTYLNQPSMSADGVQVELVANIGSVKDAEQAAASGAEGIGLFRTEFLYMDAEELPSEEMQFDAYRKVAEAFGPETPIVIRTSDIGGDKELAYLNLPKEDNPFLGYRAIRICLDRADMFKTQLRAILRASAFGNLKVMFPMVATLGEWRQAKSILDEAKQELTEAGIALNRNIEAGIMIEIPAAAILADKFAKEVDFFSIGTNDLVQYTMAADRMNPKLGYLNDPLHPAVLQLIDRVIAAAHANGKWVGMCGEMAGQKHALPILLGLGLDEFSMSASAVLPARALLAKLSKQNMKAIAQAALELGSAEEVRAYIEEHVSEIH